MPLMSSVHGKIVTYFLATNHWRDIGLVHSFASATKARILLLVHKETLTNAPSSTPINHIMAQIQNLPSNVCWKLEKIGPSTAKATDGLKAVQHTVASPTGDHTGSGNAADGSLYLTFNEIYNHSSFLELMEYVKPFGYPTIKFVPPSFEYHLPGGDMIVGEEFILIGPQTCKHHGFFDNNNTWDNYSKGFLAHHAYPPSSSIHLLRLSHADNYPLINKLYHLDLYLTYVGKNGQGEYQFIIGYIPEYTMNRANARIAKKLARYQGYLDNIETQLCDYFGTKLKIGRIPLIPDFINEGDFSGFLTFNNALVELTPKGNTIYFPNYFDASAEDYDEAFHETQTTYWKYFNKAIPVDIRKYYPLDERQSLHCFAAPLVRK